MINHIFGFARRTALARRTGHAVASLALVLLLAGDREAGAAQVVNRPVYNPASKSYFELVDVKWNERSLSKRGTNEVTWEIADRLARSRGFKGATGRLAVVTAPETHAFLLETFKPDGPAWIGLRYFCTTRTLQWSDGTNHAANGLKMWDRKWDQSVPGSGCLKEGRGWGERPYLPVVYSAVQSGFRWYAVGGAKEHNLYFVEYPTGNP